MSRTLADVGLTPNKDQYLRDKNQGLGHVGPS
jgi:hypothetical protein